MLYCYLVSTIAFSQRANLFIVHYMTNLAVIIAFWTLCQYSFVKLPFGHFLHSVLRFYPLLVFCFSIILLFDIIFLIF